MVRFSLLNQVRDPVFIMALLRSPWVPLPHWPDERPGPDAGTACQQTENKAVKTHAVYVQFVGEREKKTVLKGNDGAVEFEASMCILFTHTIGGGFLFYYKLNACQEIKKIINPNDYNEAQLNVIYTETHIVL